MGLKFDNNKINIRPLQLIKKVSRKTDLSLTTAKKKKIIV